MDNKAIAGVLYETADLLEIDGQDSFRIRSYRNAAQAIEALPQQIADLIAEPKKVLEIPGIGKGMLANLNEMFKEGRLQLHADLLKKYQPSMLDLLKIQGLGPKTISLIWSAYQVSDLEGVEKLAREGKIQILPRMGEKQEQKLLKAIQDYRRIAGRYLLDVAENEAQKIADHLRNFPGVEKVTPAGSLRRGRETVGDLDVLVTGNACIHDVEREQCIDHIIKLPGLMEIIVRGENKVSFRLRGGMKVDVRFLSPDSFGAALQYFTGSKAHNIRTREIAVRKGPKLSEYGLFDAKSGELIVASTEEEVYERLGLPWIAPTLREDRGEIEAALRGELPTLVQEKDIKGDLHTHTNLTDGLAPLEQMIAAARERGYAYYAVTDHAPNLYMQRMTDAKMLAQRKRVRQLEADGKMVLLHGSELNIDANGDVDWGPEFLGGFDVCVASVHGEFTQSKDEMTRRIVRACENPYVNIIGHPTARMIGRRAPIEFDLDEVFRAAARTGTALEINSYPDRLDLRDEHVLWAKRHGVKFAIDTDSHATVHLPFLRYGIGTAQRGWLSKDDVINTWPLAKLRTFLRKGRS